MNYSGEESPTLRSFVEMMRELKDRDPKAPVSDSVHLQILWAELDIAAEVEGYLEPQKES